MSFELKQKLLLPQPLILVDGTGEGKIYVQPTAKSLYANHGRLSSQNVIPFQAGSRNILTNENQSHEKIDSFLHQHPILS